MMATGPSDRLYLVELLRPLPLPAVDLRTGPALPYLRESEGTGEVDAMAVVAVTCRVRR